MSAGSRYERLMSLYWKAVYAEDDQSPAVREACAITKRAVENEVKKYGYQSRAERTSHD